MESLESLNYNLLDILGIGYVIDHYISYFNNRQRELAYKYYVSDSLRLITENTAKMSQGSYLKIRYADLIEPRKEETRTANEVINDLKDKLRRL